MRIDGWTYLLCLPPRIIAAVFLAAAVTLAVGGVKAWGRR